MTVKELAFFVDKDKSTVGRWIAKCNSLIIKDKLQNATRDYPAEYTIEEVGEILDSSSLSKDAVSILMANAKQEQNSLTTQNIEVDNVLLFMAKMQEQNQEFMKMMIREIREMKSTQVTIPSPVKEDRYTLIGYCSLHKIKVNRSELAFHGKNLRSICEKENKKINKVPDERWGTVNSYPVDILDDYFRA